MRPMVIACAALLTMSCVHSAAAADGLAEKRYPITTFGELVLAVPKDWHDLSVVGETGAPVPSMIELMGRDAAGGIQFKLLPLVPPMLRPEMLKDEAIKKLCERIGQQFVGGSVERKLTLIELRGDSLHGFYFTLTDARANPGEYKCITGGVFRIGEIALTMTLMHQPKQPAMTIAIDALKNAGLTSVGPTTGPASTRPVVSREVVLLAPSGKWQLRLPDLGVGTPERVQGDTRSAKYEAFAPVSGVNFTAFFEPATKAGGATVARTFYVARAKRNGMKLEKLRLAGDDRIATTHYTFFDIPNLNAYFVHQGTWIEVHLSVTDANPKTLQRLQEAIAQAEFEPVTK